MKLKATLFLSLFALGAGSAMAQELIVNGNFQQVAVEVSEGVAYSGQLYTDPIFYYPGSQVYDAESPGGSLYPFASNDFVQGVTGWKTTGYNFLFRPEDASTAGGGNGRNHWNEDDMGFWSSVNGGTGTFAASPAGGNIIALDAAVGFNRSWTDPAMSSNLAQPIWQDIDGLMIGQEYEVTFYWAAAQQYGFDGDTEEFLTVNFGGTFVPGTFVDDENWTAGTFTGGTSYTTDTYYLDSHDFSGWMDVTLRFTATATTQTLSFLAGGSPSGLPPFVLLSGVSMEAVPEPGTAVLFALGASGFYFLGSRRRKK